MTFGSTKSYKDDAPKAPDLRTQYEADGYAIVRSAVPAHEQLREAAMAALSDPRIARETGAAGGPRCAFWPSRHLPAFATFRHHPKLRDVAEDLLGTDDLKQLGERVYCRLHSDPFAAALTTAVSTLPALEPADYVMLAVALDPLETPESGGFLVAPGSHSPRPRHEDPVCPILNPGDLLVWHPALMHAWTNNTTADARRYVVTAFANAAVCPDDAAAPWVWRDGEAVGLA